MDEKSDGEAVVASKRHAPAIRYYCGRRKTRAGIFLEFVTSMGMLVGVDE